VHLVELSVMKQRYQAVMAVVQDGWKVTEVADRLGVTRQAVHKWITRYQTGGLRQQITSSQRLLAPDLARARGPDVCVAPAPTRSRPSSRQ
jgi:transposase-like protein